MVTQAIETDKPEKPEEKPTPITYKFTVRGNDVYDIEVRALGMAKEFYDDVEFQLNMEVHLSPEHSQSKFTAHVDAIRKIDWNRYC